MGRFRTLLALGLVLALASFSFAAKGNGKRGKKPVRGTVSTISADSMVVKVKQGKKKGAKTEGEKKEAETTDRTFQLDSATTFEFVTVAKRGKGEKPEITTAPAALSDVKLGERVQISQGDGTAVKKVSILRRARGGKKAAAASSS